jgi:hypothetical protein
MRPTTTRQSRSRSLGDKQSYPPEKDQTTSHMNALKEPPKDRGLLRLAATGLFFFADSCCCDVRRPASASASYRHARFAQRHRDV